MVFFFGEGVNGVATAGTAATIGCISTNGHEAIGGILAIKGSCQPVSYEVRYTVVLYTVVHCTILGKSNKVATS